MTIDMLRRAAQKGLIAPEQVNPLAEFIRQQTVNPTATDGEQLKFLRSFGDVMVTIGVVFLTLALANIDLHSWQWWLVAGGFVVLAEWLVRSRRMALTGMAILLAILYFFGLGNQALISELFPAFQPSNILEILVFPEHSSGTIALLLSLAICAAAFYWRYKMPFSLLPLAASLVGAVLVGLGDVRLFSHQWLFSVVGIAVFVAALVFDSRDRQRQLRWSDCGFWLHLLAAPLIVHGVMTSLISADMSLLDTSLRALSMIVFFLLFMLLALFIDRRAILVSSTGYGVYAMYLLLENSQIHIEDRLIFIFIGFGLFIIFLGTYWYSLRRMLFAALRNTTVARWVPRFDK